jgi:hypothetical protein
MEEAIKSKDKSEIVTYFAKPSLIFLKKSLALLQLLKDPQVL